MRRTKNPLMSIVSIILVLGILIGLGFWLFKGTNLRTVTVDKDLADNTVMVVRADKNESKEIDIKTLKVVSLGEEITVKYDGTIAINSEIESSTDYLLITGVIETKDGKLIVNNNVTIKIVKAPKVPETIVPNPAE